MSTETEKTVEAVLLKFGISTDDPIASQEEFAALRAIVKTLADPETQKDFKALREWRLAQEKVKAAGLIALAGALVSGLVAWFAWSLRTVLHLKGGSG